MQGDAPRALLGTGEVRHTRLRPVHHAFSYPGFFLLLPLRSLRQHPQPDLPRNRWGWISFHDRDHGDGGPDALAWVEALLAREGLAELVDGEIWLLCLPRVLGYAFKPVSFWFAHRADGALAAIVAEVHNTFGERHCYVLSGPGLHWGATLSADKCFHVSPFCPVQGGYRFRFMRTEGPQARAVVRIEYDDAQGPLLLTSLSGALQPLSAPALRRLAWRMPLNSLAVVWRIHWQALRLWWSGVPFFRKPEPPLAAVSHHLAAATWRPVQDDPR